MTTRCGKPGRGADDENTEDDVDNELPLADWLGLVLSVPEVDVQLLLLSGCVDVAYCAPDSSAAADDGCPKRRGEPSYSTD